METKVSEIKELKVHGRTVKSREPLVLFWTASGFECNVSGSELWVEVEVSYQTYEPWFSYTVNGDWIGRQMLQKGRYWIPLFRGMSTETVKNVRFYKDLQAMSGDGESFIRIHALRHDGVFYPVEAKKRKIEFIGDSITSGEGTFGAKEEMDWIPMFFSSLRDYAYFTAEKTDAEYRVFSQSGWGIHHSWDNNPNAAIPKYYKEVCSLMPGSMNRALGGMQPYDFHEWQPDVVVINLGTNDASGFEQPMWYNEVTGESYQAKKEPDGSFGKGDLRLIKDAAVGFLKTIRECNPHADVIWCYGMLGISLEETICEALAEYQEQSGDRKVSYLRLPEVTKESFGSRQHPGILCHKQAADVLVEYMRKTKII